MKAAQAIQQFFRRKPYDLEPAIQKYRAIESLVEKDLIAIDYDRPSATIVADLWNIYAEQKRPSVLNNILFFINFGNAAEGKKADHTILSFSIAGTDVRGVYDDGKISYEKQ